MASVTRSSRRFLPILTSPVLTRTGVRRDCYPLFPSMESTEYSDTLT